MVCQGFVRHIIREPGGSPRVSLLCLSRGSHGVDFPSARIRPPASSARGSCSCRTRLRRPRRWFRRAVPRCVGAGGSQGEHAGPWFLQVSGHFSRKPDGQAKAFCPTCWCFSLARAPEKHQDRFRDGPRVPGEVSGRPALVSSPPVLAGRLGQQGMSREASVWPGGRLSCAAARVSRQVSRGSYFGGSSSTRLESLTMPEESGLSPRSSLAPCSEDT